MTKDEMSKIINKALIDFDWSAYKSIPLPDFIANVIAGARKVGQCERLYIAENSELRSDLEREKASKLYLKDKLKEAQGVIDALDKEGRELRAEVARQLVEIGQFTRQARSAEATLKAIREALR